MQRHDEGREARDELMEKDRESDGEAELKRSKGGLSFSVLSVYSIANQLTKSLTSLFNWLELDVTMGWRNEQPNESVRR